MQAGRNSDRQTYVKTDRCTDMHKDRNKDI
jgi:hypothetical protein